MIERERVSANYIMMVLLVAIILRLCVPLIASTTTKDENVFYTPDTVGYCEPAMNLLSSGQYMRGGLPEIFRPPGYPVLLIPGLLSGRPELLTIAFQIILSCLTVFLVYKIALTLFERTDIAVLSACLYALEPLSIVYTGLIMAETLFAFMVTLSVYLVIRYLKAAKFTFFCAAALVLSAAVFVRPVGYFLPIVIVIVLLAASAVRKDLNKKLFIHSCIFLVIAMAPLFAWQARNKIEAGYSGFSATRDEILFLTGQAISAKIQGISGTEQKKRSGWSFWNGPERYFMQHPEHRAWDQAQIHQRRGAEGLLLIVENPWQYLQVHTRSALLIAGLTGFSTWLNLFKIQNVDSPFYAALRNPSSLGFIQALARSGPTILWGNLFLAVMLLIYWLVAFYALTFRQLRCDAGVILLVLIGVYFLVAPGAWADSRYRHPVMPLLCVVGGYGLSALIAKIVTLRKSIVE